ncbi:response regulator transcription factor [Brevundimonas pondensis]
MDRIVVADDHPLFRAALRSAVEKAAPGAVIAECASLAEVLAALGEGRDRPAAAGPEAVGQRGHGRVDAYSRGSSRRAGGRGLGQRGAADRAPGLTLGAAGFIPKSAALPVMVEAITAILSGEAWAPDVGAPGPEEGDLESRIASLTPSQLRILEGLRAGRLNKQIAFDLGVTEATIKAHLTSVFRKLGVHNRTQAVILAQSIDL